MKTEKNFNLGEALLDLHSLDAMIENAKVENISEILKELTRIKNETEQAIYIEKLAKKLNIGKRAILKDIKKLKDQTAGDLIYCASFPGLVDVALDENNYVIYLIKLNDTSLSIAREFYDVNGNKCFPPEKENLPFSLPRAKEVFEWVAKDDLNLFNDVMQYFKRFSFLKANQWQVVAFNVFLTYIHDHPDIHYLPMLLFYAVPERGKSRTGKTFTYIAYRGVHQVDMREANLFRYAQNLQVSFFFDIKDIWKKAERSGSEDILLLRYEKGATVSRVLYPERGAFKDMVHFNVYGPTIIATNEAVHKILDSRCIPITMPNRPGNYENPTPEKAQELKERLTAWRAKVMDKPLPEVALLQELNGRLWDISQPLLQVCKLVCPESFETLKKALIEIAGQRLEDKKGSIEGQIVLALYELSPEAESVLEWTLKTQEVLELLNKTRPDAYKLTSQYLGRKLKAIGLSTKIIMGYSQIHLKRLDFNLLLVQYGIIENNNVPVPVETLPNSTNLSNQGISTVYDSRKLVESQENSTETLLSQSLDNKGFESLVESSRELQDIGEKKYLKTLEVVE
ncbi:MAG: DUF3631 domain-containing protein [Nitrospira sp.]|nr:DUF3631 domain-containing protein [Nitrospira sp.]